MNRGPYYSTFQLRKRCKELGWTIEKEGIRVGEKFVRWRWSDSGKIDRAATVAEAWKAEYERRAGK